MLHRPIIGIIAATQQGVISCHHALPWNYPDERKHFKNTTQNQTIIMGHQTYRALPKTVLLNRNVIVLSKNKSLSLEDAQVMTSLEQCLDYLLETNSQKPIFMIGGTQIAHLFLINNLLTSFILTKIHHTYSGDTYLDLKHLNTWPKNSHS